MCATTQSGNNFDQEAKIVDPEFYFHLPREYRSLFVDEFSVVNAISEMGDLGEFNLALSEESADLFGVCLVDKNLSPAKAIKAAQSYTLVSGKLIAMAVMSGIDVDTVGVPTLVINSSVVDESIGKYFSRTVQILSNPANSKRFAIKHGLMPKDNEDEDGSAAN